MNASIDDIERRLKAGDFAEFGAAFTHHRPRLWQTIHFRLHDRVRSRVDVEDVLQDVYLDAEQRLQHFLDGDFPSLFLWLRLVAAQTLSRTHRRHLSTESRSTLREASLGIATGWGETSLHLSQRFVAHLTSPSRAVARRELISEVNAALEGMGETDREVLALRHFEELTN